MSQHQPDPHATSAPRTTPAIPLERVRGILFDLDGVLTPTAEVHMRAWSRLFTPELDARGAEPYSDADYFAHIDGKPRYDGVRALLASRGITLPEGSPTDAPELETVCGLGNRKDAAFNAELDEHGVTAYPGSVAFLDACEAAGVEIGVVTSSRNGRRVLTAAGLIDRFEVIVDGLLAEQRGLPGKPAGDTYVHGAELLGLAPAECAILEDAVSGAAAGRDGGFGLVIGVDRGAGADALAAAGADTIVTDLAELVDGLPDGTASAHP